MGTVLIVAIVPKESIETLVSDEMTDLCDYIVRIQARGTMKREEWTDRFLPFVQPEECIVQFIVNKTNANAVIDILIKNGRLDCSNSGTLMVFPCHYMTADKKVKTISKSKKSKQLKSDLNMIVAIMQKEKADSLAAYALSLGIAGPTIIFGNGKGIRDRMGLVRIAINPEKEIVTMVVSRDESDMIFEKLCVKGDFHLAGEGLIYEVPVTEGILNSPSVVTSEEKTVSMSQVVQAIDELKGSKKWRRNLGESFGGPADNNLDYLENLECLSCYVPEEVSESVVMAALQAGAPAASLYHGECVKPLSHKKENQSSVSLGNPQDVIEFVLAKEMVEKVTNAIKKELLVSKNKEFVMINHPIKRAFTYLE
tara:strand:+ start:288 stop:1391 length:1104 start_codon:yes stop_codon:yes gene_type:complete